MNYLLKFRLQIAEDLLVSDIISQIGAECLGNSNLPLLDNEDSFMIHIL